LAALRHEFFADLVSGFWRWDQHELLQIARVVTFIEQLLADEDDTGTAQPLAPTGQRLRHLLLAILDECHGVALDTDTQPVPLSVVEANAQVDLQRSLGSVFVSFVIEQRDRLAD